MGVLFFPPLLKLHSSFSDPLVLLSHLACVLMAMSTLVYDPLGQRRTTGRVRAEAGINLGSLKLMPYLDKVASGLS